MYISVSFDEPMPTGAIGLFSLKNPSFPEWICMTDSPVMSLDFNRDNPHLLVIGKYSNYLCINKKKTTRKNNEN